MSRFEITSTEPQQLSVEPGEVTAQLDRKGLKSLFYLMSGRRDTSVKRFAKPRRVDIASLERLNRRVHEKLANHEMLAATTISTVSLRKGVTQEFGDFAAFLDYNWKDRPEATEEIQIRWECLFQLPNIEIPQKHSLSLNVSAGINPKALLQSMFSGDPDDLDAIANMATPAYCRVDFINQVLCQELTALVANWFETLPECFEQSEWRARIEKIESFPRIVMSSVKHLLGALVTLTGVALLINVDRVSEQELATSFGVSKLAAFSTILFLGWYAALVARSIGRWIGRRLVVSIKESGNRDHVFCLTSGDSQLRDRLKTEAHKASRKLVIDILLAFAVNLAAGIALHWALPG